MPPRPATPADRERIRALLPAEARATFDRLPPEADAQMMVLDNDDGSLRGALTAQSRASGMFLQTILLTRGTDPEGFRLLLLGLARHALTLGHVRAQARTTDRAIMLFGVRRYGLTAIPSGTRNGEVAGWRFDVDLLEFIATLEAAG